MQHTPGMKEYLSGISTMRSARSVTVQYCCSTHRALYYQLVFTSLTRHTCASIYIQYRSEEQVRTLTLSDTSEPNYQLRFHRPRNNWILNEMNRVLFI